MSTAGNSTGGSRQSNESYPASAASGRDAADLDHRPDVPTVAERVSGILESYPERALRPLSAEHGRTLRADCLEEPETAARTIQVGEHESVTVHDTTAREALPWIGAVETLLRKYESYRDKWLKMSRGSERRGDYEAFEISLSMSYSPEYQSMQYARLKALKRQTVGGEYPGGQECEGRFERPVVSLLGLTASSLEAGEYRPPVDHDREIRDTWSGSSSSVKRSLRYLLEDKMGLESHEYVWWWQSEPHPGPDKAATGYSHSHPVVILDEAAVAADAPEPTDPETWRGVVAKHVAECGSAGWDAHRLEDAVSVSRADEIHDIVGYVSEYLAVSPDQDLLERSDEYLLWAAAQFAGATQKYSRSKWATAAAQADACQQRYYDGETRQTHEHGERVVRASAGAHHTLECAACGSPHGIDQSADSLARYRLDEAASPSPSSAVATDGGSDVSDAQADEGPRSSAPESFAERWPSARSGGRISSPVREPGEAAEVTIEGFEREPEWSPESVIQRWSDEETVIGEPSGVEYGEVVVPGAESILETTPLEYLPPPETVAGPEPWRESSLLEESDVRLGLVPPPELIARELVERTRSGREVTAKRWESDWYERRFGESSSTAEPDGDGESQLASGISRSTVERVRELVRTESITSVPSVLGRLEISPEYRGEVAEIVAECS